MKGQHYLAGKWRSSEGETFTSINPVTNEVLWQGNQAGAPEVEEAFLAAQQALAEWAVMPLSGRAQFLQNFAQLIEQRAEKLTLLISMETGKPLWESATEVASVAAKIPLSLQAFQQRSAEKHTQTAEAKASLRYKPHGVVAILGAFNFPAHLSNGHIVPALLAGNTVIYKPSELTPATAEFILECWQDSGLPAGVLNGIQGDARTGRLLLNCDIKGVFFTGSYQVGKTIHQHFSERPEVILALEMGGNNPLVIDEVKDLDAAVYNTILSSYISAGQRCTCARRVYLPDNAYGDGLLNRLMTATAKIKVGACNDKPEPFMGSVIRYQHAVKHLEAQQQLLKSGGVALLPMTLLRPHTGLLSPGIIDMSGVPEPPDEEIFAPLIQLFRCNSFDEALIRANQTRYGLACGLLSDSPYRFEQFYQSMRSGLINWNRPTTGASGTLPFGGTGKSGNHRPSAFFAADYCSYPVAGMEAAELTIPAQLLPGISLDG